MCLQYLIPNKQRKNTQRQRYKHALFNFVIPCRVRQVTLIHLTDYILLSPASMSCIKEINERDGWLPFVMTWTRMELYPTLLYCFRYDTHNPSKRWVILSDQRHGSRKDQWLILREVTIQRKEGKAIKRTINEMDLILDWQVLGLAVNQAYLYLRSNISLDTWSSSRKAIKVLEVITPLRAISMARIRLKCISRNVFARKPFQNQHRKPLNCIHRNLIYQMGGKVIEYPTTRYAS